MTSSYKGGWEDITLQDLLFAYRKAKADCFFERSTYETAAFIDYENDLSNNLYNLIDRLKQDGLSSVLYSGLGVPRVFSKRLSFSGDAKPAKEHTFFSDPDRAFEQTARSRRLIPEFRLVGKFNVEFHTLSALWINLVGHKYDARLRKNCYGSRLRRYSDRLGNDGRPLDGYHEEAVGSFDPYFRPYKAWRDGGMDAVKSSLEKDQSIIAVTLDFASYYHNVDPAFMTSKSFTREIGVDLNEWELSFTNSLVESLSVWSSKSGKFLNGGMASNTGLPIGSSAVRVIANCLLANFDDILIDKLNPVYYGRYVDDVFLVLNDPGDIFSSEDLWGYVSSRTGIFSATPNSNYEVRLPGEYQGNTRLLLQKEKQRIFFLKGQPGLDLLDNIAHQIRSLSSERRLMPLPDDLESTASARALAASETTSEDPDSLRRADGLTIRRLGWALQLRSVEILSRDLDPTTWTDQRASFYEFAKTHILRPDKILEQLDYIPRLLSLAISMADWKEADGIYRSAKRALKVIEAATNATGCRINGVQLETTPPELWQNLTEWVEESCRDAIIRSFPWDQERGSPQDLPQRAADFLRMFTLSVSDAQKLSIAAREADLALTSYKDHLRRDASRERRIVEDENRLEYSYPPIADLREFLEKTRGEVKTTGVRRIRRRARGGSRAPWSILPYLAPTRPYSAQDVALYLPDECVFGAPEPSCSSLARYLRAIRGTWSRPGWEPPAPPLRPAGIGGQPPPPHAFLGSSDGVIRLGITSLATSDDAWARGAAGKTDLSPDRYERLATIVNLAIKAKPKITHLLLPELSLPEPWLRTISGVLLDSGISLIAGLDYDHFEGQRISSSAVLVLTDARLGYPAPIEIRQPKALPAPGEEEHLHVSHGRRWRDWRGGQKPIYNHNGCYFGVLICSELQDVSHRKSFQGNVDILSILSWNKDLDTFSALIESAALDVHAYIAIVNNRRYGDSRVRCPSATAYNRDVCRLKGGDNDHLVVVEISMDDLRAQQSRAFRWKVPGDKYKPAPEGFRISPSRRTIAS